MLNAVGIIQRQQQTEGAVGVRAGAYRVVRQGQELQVAFDDRIGEWLQGVAPGFGGIINNSKFMEFRLQLPQP